MSEHTPTPWAVEENCLGVYPLSARQGPLTVHPAKSFGEADAAFIVKAVNNHDALVEALRSMLEPYHGLPAQPPYFTAAVALKIEAARAALAGAGGVVGAQQPRGADVDK